MWFAAAVVVAVGCWVNSHLTAAAVASEEKVPVVVAAAAVDWKVVSLATYLVLETFVGGVTWSVAWVTFVVKVAGMAPDIGAMLWPDVFPPMSCRKVPLPQAAVVGVGVVGSVVGVGQHMMVAPLPYGVAAVVDADPWPA